MTVSPEHPQLVIPRNVRIGPKSVLSGKEVFRRFFSERDPAIEIGAHRFCHREKGRITCGTCRFVHVWKQTDQGWKIARVVSYGH